MIGAIERRLLPLQPYWRWWLGELGAMIPERLLPSGRPRVRIRFPGSAVEVERSAGGHTELHRDERPLAELDAAAWAELAALCRDAETIAILPETKLLNLTLRLPRATLRSLDDAIRLQLLREAPLESDALHWTRQVERVTRDAVEVRVCLARRVDVDRLGAAFATGGVPAPAIGCDGPSGIALFEKGARHEASSEVRADRRAMWIALALLVSIPFTTLALLALRANATEQQIMALTDRAGARSRDLSRLRAAAAASRELRVLVTREPLSAAIERLAGELPPDAWLAAVRVSPETGLEADIVTPDPASLEGFAIINQRPEGERSRVTVRAPR